MYNESVVEDFLIACNSLISLYNINVLLYSVYLHSGVSHISMMLNNAYYIMHDAMELLCVDVKC